MIDNALDTVSDINRRYKELSALSHDELRHKFQELREKVGSSDVILDDFLVEVFAIVKDTMRRFAENEKIEVVATEVEKGIAESCDYVSVDGEKAVYSNKWEAGGEPFAWDMILYDEQLQGGVELHNGRIIQMATGEGKTFVAVAPAVLNSLTGKKVHIMTVNDYLSRRDFEITRPIYSFLGLTTGCVVGLKRYSEDRKTAYSRDITFGSNSDFIFDYLYDHISDNSDKCVQQEFDFCIVDEADSVLLDEAQTPHVISNRSLSDCGDRNLYDEYLSLVKRFVSCYEDNDFFKIDSLRKSVTVTDSGKKWLAEQVGNALLYDTEHYKRRIQELEENKGLTEEQRKGLIEAENNRQYERITLQNVLIQLLRALTLFERDRDYIVEKGMIVIVDAYTGRPKYSHRWQYGLHEAIIAKEGVESVINEDSIRATISMKNYVSMYRKISGMTGTAVSAKDEFMEVYGLDVASVPTHKPNIRDDRPLRIFKTVRDKENAVLSEIGRLHSQHRPVLIGVDSVGESKRIGELLEKNGYEIRLLNAETLKEEAGIISQAGMKDSITVATSVAGRGTDIKPSLESLSNGGLAIIGINMASSKRIDEQLIGRSGRQGNPGSSQFFVSVKDEIIGYLTDEDREELDSISKSGVDSELKNPLAKDLFVKAQAVAEEEESQRRKCVAEEDDVIDGHRRLLYGFRASLLKREGGIEGIIVKLSPTLNEPAFRARCQSVNEAIIAKSLPIIGQAVLNIHTIDKISLIPLLYNDKIYTIKCDFEDALKSKGEVIIEEMHRWLIFNLIDKYWTMFINKINTNLIPASEYEQIYEKIYDEMVEELKNALLNIQIAVWDMTPVKDVKLTIKEQLLSATKEDLLSPFDLCPCGSGKQYCLCHGSM